MAHLDRREIFLFLNRTSNVPVRELVVLLDVFLTGPQWDLAKLVEHAPYVFQLSQQFGLPVAKIAHWWGTTVDPKRKSVVAENIGVSFHSARQIAHAIYGGVRKKCMDL